MFERVTDVDCTLRTRFVDGSVEVRVLLGQIRSVALFVCRELATDE